MYENEIWKDVVGFEGRYKISNIGRVWSIRYDREIKQRLEDSGKGYWEVWLSHKPDFNGKLVYVHRLVALAFISNPENKPQVNHKDGVSQNNRLDNLEWSTHMENIEHGVRHGLFIKNKGELNGRCRLSEKDVLAIRTMKGKKTQPELATKYGVSVSAIGMIHCGLTWKHLLLEGD